MRDTGEKITPDELYSAKPLKRFMNKCKTRKVQWAIFSDKYGVWFPNEKNEWYDKNPNKVTEKEYRRLVKDFEFKLDKYDQIYFYHNPGRFHSLYKKLLGEVNLKNKIVLFSHLDEIM